MKRLPYAIPIAAVALFPVVAWAEPAQLSPPLDTVLVSAPSGFDVFTMDGFPHGFFGLDWYAGTYGSKSAEASQLLQKDGFVGGYTLQWRNVPQKHVLIESVFAFKGKKGAVDWQQYAQASDQSEAGYQHADTTTGLGTYYGEHYAYPSGDVLDAFIFIKGNDMFVVGFESTRDDVLDLAIAQTRRQYESAPDSTIPSSQWPENASAPIDVRALVSMVRLLAVLVVIGGIAVAILRMRRREAMALGSNRLAPIAPQISADGNFWYDGQNWIDSSLQAPPFAPHLPDGSMWWDGSTWRPVPATAQPRASGR